jgi:hypothetical protein
MQSKLKGASPFVADRCFDSEMVGTRLGITFHLPSRCRFIPYSWLLHAELNEAGTELYLHYTHSVVIIIGTHLEELHEAVKGYQLHAVRETPPSPLGQVCSVSRIEIAENVSA